MVDEEEAVGIVFLFDLGEAGVVCAPVGMLKVGLEEVAFRDVGSAVWRRRRGVRSCSGVRCPRPAALGNVGLVIGNSGIRGALAVGDNGKSKGAAHRGIHRSVFCRLDGFRRRAGEPLIEMKFDLAEAGS